MQSRISKVNLAKLGFIQCKKLDSRNYTAVGIMSSQDNWDFVNSLRPSVGIWQAVFLQELHRHT